MTVRQRVHHHHHRPDLVLEAAYARIADLRTVARTSRPGDAGSSRGPLATLRDAVGRRLIAIGSALVTDETLRRRPALRP